MVLSNHFIVFTKCDGPERINLNWLCSFFSLNCYNMSHRYCEKCMDMDDSVYFVILDEQNVA
jgi:hypothetical protein